MTTEGRCAGHLRSYESSRDQRSSTNGLSAGGREGRRNFIPTEFSILRLFMKHEQPKNRDAIETEHLRGWRHRRGGHQLEGEPTGKLLLFGDGMAWHWVELRLWFVDGEPAQQRCGLSEVV